MKSTKETKVMAVLKLLERRPHTSLELMHAVGSPSVRILIGCLRDKGYNIKTHQLPSFGDESAVFQYELVGAGQCVSPQKGGDEYAQCKSKV